MLSIINPSINIPIFYQDIPIMWWADVAANYWSDTSPPPPSSVPPSLGDLLSPPPRSAVEPGCQ